jgi:hypothetical protein
MNRKKVKDLLDSAQEAREIAETLDVSELKEAMLKQTYEKMPRRARDHAEARCRRSG